MEKKKFDTRSVDLFSNHVKFLEAILIEIVFDIPTLSRPGSTISHLVATKIRPKAPLHKKKKKKKEH